MPKGQRGGKRNNRLGDTIDSKTIGYGKPKENNYFVDSTGAIRIDGVNGWKLTFGSHTPVEIDDGEWLQDIIGERVYLNPKADKPDGQKSSDYITESGVRVEQKGPPKNKGGDKIINLIKQGEGQANIFLVNITGLNLTKSEIDRQVYRAMYEKHSRKYAHQVIIKDGDKLIGWYKK